MKAQELRDKSATELTEELVALKRELFNLRMQLGSGQMARIDQFSRVKRDIARVKTVQNEQAKA